MATLGKPKKKKTEELVESWKKRFNNIENKDMPKLTDNLIEVENLCVNKDLKGAKEALSLAEKNIFHVKAKSYKLLNEIKELTESEERNREAVTKLNDAYLAVAHLLGFKNVNKDNVNHDIMEYRVQEVNRKHEPKHEKSTKNKSDDYEL